MNSKTKKYPFTLTLGVLATFTISQGGVILNPALNSLYEMFSTIPTATVTLLVTIPSLIVMPVSLFSGTVTGIKIKYRTMVLISLVLSILCGILPFFLTNFYAILATRVVLGIAAGLGVPCSSALVMRLFDEEKGAALQGIGMTVMNLAGVLLLNLSGVLCAINVKYVWLVHLAMIIPLLLALFFLKEPEKIITETTGNTLSSAKEKSKVPARAWFIAIAYGLSLLFFYPFTLNMSSIIAQNGLNVSFTGTVLSMYTIAGMLAGAVFGFAYKHFKRSLTTICMILIVLSMVLTYFGRFNIIALGAAAFIGGIGHFTLWPACMMDLSLILPADRSVFGTGLFTAFMNLGVFLSSAFMAIVINITKSTNPITPIVIGACFEIILTVIWTLAKLSKHKTLNKPEETV